MSVCITFTCDECGESEAMDLGALSHLWGGVDALELPEGWEVDPVDDENHLCDCCANPTKWEPREPPLAGHPNPARALREGQYWERAWSVGGGESCSPKSYCGHCRECLRQGLWNGGGQYDR